MIWPGRLDHDISLMIWPGRPNHDIEGWDLFSKNSGSREELKMVQHRSPLRSVKMKKLARAKALTPELGQSGDSACPD